MRIVSISKAVGSTTLDGNRLNLRTWVELSGLLDADVESLMLSPNGQWHTLQEGRVRITLLPVPRTRLLSEAVYLWRFFRKATRNGRPALVVASDPALSGLAAWMSSRKMGVPLQVHLQGDLFAVPPGVFSALKRVGLRTLARFVCGQAEQVRCVAQAIRQAAADAGVPEDKLVVVRNRVDLELFDPGRLSGHRRALRRQLGWSVDDPVALFVGSMNRFKGLGILLEGFQAAQRSVRELRLLMIGDGPLRGTVEQEVKAAGLHDRVALTGRLPHSKVAEAMACGDILLVPSASEGLPRVVLEGSALQLPVIASAVGGIPEAVDEGETGFLIEPGDAACLAARLAELAVDPRRRADMGARGRAKMREEFEFHEALGRLATATRALLPSG